MNTKQHYQDIAFFNIEKTPPPPKKSNPLIVALGGALFAVVLIGIGYCVGVRAGAFEPPCCLALDFDFE